LRLAIEDESFVGVPATGTEIAIGAIGILRIVDGRLVERWNVTDVLGLRQQIGALPEQFGD